MHKKPGNKLLQDIKNCQICRDYLPFEPSPVLQFSPKAKILIAGQAPGIRVHETGIPFNDQSGERLREWMGISDEVFYNPDKVAILPMGFCYPGTGKSGDLPPRKECALAWRPQLLKRMINLHMTILIGQYAIDWHLGDRKKKTLTETVKSWEEYTPEYFVLPHPSPRNNIWLKKNYWFEKEIIPALQNRIKKWV